MRRKLISLIILLFCITLFSNKVYSQNVGIGDSEFTPDASAILDVNSADKGILIPRIALTNSTLATPVTAPAEGLLIYNTATINDVVPGYYLWEGTKWAKFFIGEQSDDWVIDGNAGTINGTHFIGTTDAQDLDFRTNDTIRLRLTTQGQLETLNTGGSIFIGENAGENDDLDNNKNIFIGNSAGELNDRGKYNIAIGDSSLYANLPTVPFESSYNTAVGHKSLKNNTTGSANTAFGYSNLYSNTTGSNNISTGYLSLYHNTIGNSNISIGTEALFFNTEGYNNIAIGSGALHNNKDKSKNIAIGNMALHMQSYNGFGDKRNIAIGDSALFFTNATDQFNGTNNLAI